MAWIRQVEEDEAEGKIAEIYQAGRARAGQVANIIKVMSLRPELLESFMGFYVRLMKGKSNLTRSDRELLATVTSQLNGCFY